MATYRHKVKWTIATEKWLNYEIEITNSPSSWYTCVLPKWIVENSSDRELVEERDWIDDVIDFYWMIAKADDREDTKKYLRIAIEKHTPKQKKFTKNEIYDFYK